MEERDQGLRWRDAIWKLRLQGVTGKSSQQTEIHRAVVKFLKALSLAEDGGHQRTDLRVTTPSIELNRASGKNFSQSFYRLLSGRAS